MNHPSLPAPPHTPAAFTALVNQHQRAIFGFIYGLVGHSEQARDLTQDTFYQAWRAVLQQKPPFTAEGQPEEVKAWLFQVAYSRAISALRRHRLIFFESFEARHAHHPHYPDRSGSFEADIAEREMLQAALARLTPSDVACLLLRVVQGFSAAETGAILGVSPTNMHKKLFRAKERLRKAYLALDEQPPSASRRKEVYP